MKKKLIIHHCDIVEWQQQKQRWVNFSFWLIPFFWSLLQKHFIGSAYFLFICTETFSLDTFGKVFSWIDFLVAGTLHHRRQHHNSYFLMTHLLQQQYFDMVYQWISSFKHFFISFPTTFILSNLCQFLSSVSFCLPTPDCFLLFFVCCECRLP